MSGWSLRYRLGYAIIVSATLAAAAAAPAGAPMAATNLPGVSTHLAPPPGFDALNASDADLARHGFPPRPDRQKAPEAYRAWERAVTVPVQRVAPTLEQTQVFHSPARIKSMSGPEAGANATSASSTNWSGYAIYDPAKPFPAEAIYSEFIVPIAQQAFGTCSGSWDYGSTWAGIDGFASPDVLQAGIEFDAYCSGTTKHAFYSAWYEWYPSGSVRVSNMQIRPGDVVAVQVWNTSPTTANTYIVNYTTQQSASLAFSAPAGTVLQGDSVEWIVERPAICSSSCTLANLTNYVAEPLTKNYAWNFNSSNPQYYYPGANPTGTSYNITMVDNSNNPISSPSLVGTMDLWFYDEGSAY